MRLRDLRTGTDLDEVIPDTTYGTAWAGDTTCFYVRPDEMERPYRCGATRSARPRRATRSCTRRTTKRFFVSVGLSLTEAWVHIQQRLEGDHRGAPHPGGRPHPPAAGRAAPRAGRGVRRHPRPTSDDGDRLRDPHQRRRRGELQARQRHPRRARPSALGRPRTASARREARGDLRVRRPPGPLRAPGGHPPDRRDAPTAGRPSGSW